MQKRSRRLVLVTPVPGERNEHQSIDIAGTIYGGFDLNTIGESVLAQEKNRGALGRFWGPWPAPERSRRLVL
ncbi:MAG: hypothetical protein WCH07_11715, partial [Deltaproteobacteria bacterium]